MSLNPRQVEKLKKLISNYAESAIADSWAGSADPDDYESIVESCELAKQKLDNFIVELTKE